MMSPVILSAWPYLAAAVARSDKAVAEALAALGETNVRLTPLTGGPNFGAANLGAQGSGAGGVGSQSPGGVVDAAAAANQDPEATLLEQYRAQLEAAAAQTKAALAAPAPAGRYRLTPD